METSKKLPLEVSELIKYPLHAHVVGGLLALLRAPLGQRTGRQTERQTDRQAGRQTDRQTHRQADRQTDRQTDRQAGPPQFAHRPAE